jgi:hypothetical protein
MISAACHSGFVANAFSDSSGRDCRCAIVFWLAHAIWANSRSKAIVIGDSYQDINDLSMLEMIYLR